MKWLVFASCNCMQTWLSEDCHCVKSIYSFDAFRDESYPHTTITRKGYPAKRIDIYSRQKPKFGLIYKTTEKAVYIRLAFKGEHTFNHGRHRQRSDRNRIPPAPDLHIL